MICIAAVLMIVVSFWIVLPLSAGTGPDQFAQYHPTSDPKRHQPSPNMQYPRSAPSAPTGAPAVKGTPSSTSQTRSVRQSPRVTSRSSTSSAKVKSVPSSTSQAQSVKQSSRVTSRPPANSATAKSTPSSTSQTRSTPTSPGGTSQGSATSAQAKSSGSAPAASSSTPGSTSSSSQSTRGLDPARRYGEALTQGMYDPKGVPGSTPGGGSTAASGKTSQSSKPSADPAKGNSSWAQPSKTSADPTKGSTSWTPTKTGGATSGPGATGPEAHHHRTGGATSGSGATGPEAHHHPTPGVSNAPYAPGFSGPQRWSPPLLDPGLRPGSFPSASQPPPGYLGPNASGPAPGDPTLPPGNMIAGGDDEARAEAAAAATTAITPDDDPAVFKLFGKDGTVKVIGELESQAASSRQLANQFTEAADTMLANFRNKNGDITKEDLDKMKAYATAGGFRSQAFLNSPPEVQARVNKFESKYSPLNVTQAISLGYQGTVGGDKEANKTLYQMEIKRSRMMATKLNNAAQEAQAQADSLRKSVFGSTQPTPTSTETK
jgi:hypothetical protein